MRNRSSVNWFTQNACNGQYQSQPKLSVPLMEAAGTQVLSQSSAAFQGILAGSKGARTQNSTQFGMCISQEALVPIHFSRTHALGFKKLSEGSSR